MSVCVCNITVCVFIYGVYVLWSSEFILINFIIYEYIHTLMNINSCLATPTSMVVHRAVVLCLVVLLVPLSLSHAAVEKKSRHTNNWAVLVSWKDIKN